MTRSLLRFAGTESALVFQRQRRHAQRRRWKPVSLAVQSLEPRLALAVGVAVDFAKKPTPPADTTPPSIRSITAPKAHTYGEERTIAFRVDFTEPVVATGVPTLPITVGDIVRQAVWNGKGSGTKSIVFTTVVQAGDVAPTGVQVAGPIVLPSGAAIRDKAGNYLTPAASGEFARARSVAIGPSVSDFGAIAVAGKRVSLRVTFTEPVTVRGKPSIPFTLNGAQRKLIYTRGSGRNVLVFEYRATRREAPTLASVELATPSLQLGRARLIGRAGEDTVSLAPPTDIALSLTSIVENAGTAAVVGALFTTDPDADAGDAFTYTLVSGTGSADNAAFNISGSQLQASASFDFEAKSWYSVRLRSTDQGGLFTEKAFTITVIDVDETAPVITLSNQSPNPNGPIAVVGLDMSEQLLGFDPFTDLVLHRNGQPVSLAGVGWHGYGLAFTLQPFFDYNGSPGSYVLRISAATSGITDLAGNPLAGDAVLSWVVNAPPTDIALSATSIAENAGANAVVGTFTTTDPDASNTFIYTLVSGSGSTDNAAFNISGSQLRATASFDFETKSSYSVRVRSTDQGGLFTEKTFTIAVADTAEFTLAVLDPLNLLPSDTKQHILRLGTHALDRLTQHITWKGIVDAEVHIRPASDNPNPTANGLMPSITSLSWQNGSWSNDTLREMLTGEDPKPQAADAGMTIYLGNDGKIRNYGNLAWFDPSPLAFVPAAVPDGCFDFMGVFQHEVFHGIGFVAASREFAALTTVINGNDFFIGQASQQLFGGPLPLAPRINGVLQDHYGNTSLPGNTLSSGLMFQWGNYAGNRLDVGRLDLAVLQDLGIVVTNTQGLPLVDTLDSQAARTTLSRYTVDESSPSGTVVGVLGTTAGLAGTTYALATGGVDNSAFYIEDNRLKINTVPNFSAKPSYSILVKNVSPGGVWTATPMTITVASVV